MRIKMLGLSIVMIILSAIYIGHAAASASSVYYEYSVGKLKVVFSQKNNSYYKTEMTYDANGNLLSKKTSPVGKVDSPATVHYSRSSYDVYAIGIDPSVTAVRFPTWNTADGSGKWWYAGVKVAPGIWKANIVFNNHAGGIGNYTTAVYIGDQYWGESNTSVVIQNVAIQAPTEVKLSNEQYDIIVNNIDESVTSVRFPTWTLTNDKDDVEWKPGVRISPTSWKVTIKFSDHHYETGIYQTDIYTYDSKLKPTYVTNVPDINIVSGVKAPSETSYANASYDVYAYGVDPAATNVFFPSRNDRVETNYSWYPGTKVSAGVWKATVVFNNHAGGFGDYSTHVYVDGKIWGNSKTKVIGEVKAPSETSYANASYDVYAYGVDPAATNVFFPSRNDRVETNYSWYPGTKVSSGVWKATVVFNNHAGGFGDYITHVYVDGKIWGNSKTKVVQTSSVQAPSQVSLVNLSYDIIINGVGENVANVMFPTWTLTNDQYVAWKPGVKISPSSWKVTINLSEYHNETGLYRTYVYFYDKYGNFTYTPVPDIKVS